MIGFELENQTAAGLIRFIKTLGQHRYVASRLHLVHVFAIDAAELPESAAWVAETLASVDVGSKDDRLWRRATDAELVAVLTAFWTGERAPDRLRDHLARLGVEPPVDRMPFDEADEDDVFPVLVDAGWELVPLARLEPERHRGAIESFADFEVARFEEENAVPQELPLHELPLIGPTELLNAFEPDGRTRAPFVLWQQGHESYLDYVLRGVLKVAKIDL